MTPLTLSRSKLTDFLACQRRFQLRYQQRHPWPAVPLDAESEKQLEQGRQFHQLIERHFLSLPIQIEDKTVRHWWSQFQTYLTALPSAHYLPELALTVPVGEQTLTGRFDLLAISQAENGRYQAHIYDWKTGNPQPEARLREDWQTRLYLAMLAESGTALQEKVPAGKTNVGANIFQPDDIAITYWYVAEPDAPRTISYNTQWHAQNWADINNLVAQITQSSALSTQSSALSTQHSDDWPLTDDWTQCRYCAYQVLCGRSETAVRPETAVASPALFDEESDPLPDWQLEPDLP